MILPTLTKGLELLTSSAVSGLAGALDEINDLTPSFTSGIRYSAEPEPFTLKGALPSMIDLAQPESEEERRGYNFVETAVPYLVGSGAMAGPNAVRKVFGAGKDAVRGVAPYVLGSGTRAATKMARGAARAAGSATRAAGQAARAGKDLYGSALDAYTTAGRRVGAAVASSRAAKYIEPVLNFADGAIVPLLPGASNASRFGGLTTRLYEEYKHYQNQRYKDENK